MRLASLRSLTAEDAVMVLFGCDTANSAPRAFTGQNIAMTVSRFTRGGCTGLPRQELLSFDGRPVLRANEWKSFGRNQAI